jgi:heme/copper-type cytochrome/quinol oxidase subunit 2
MKRIQVLRISKYFLNILVLATLWLFVSICFTYYKISMDWSKLEMVFSIISHFLPFTLLVLAIITVINYCIEKYLEKENRKEFLKILAFHSSIMVIIIILYSYQFYTTVMV